VPKGQTLGIVGRNGSGKVHSCKLLPELYRQLRGSKGKWSSFGLGAWEWIQFRVYRAAKCVFNARLLSQKEIEDKFDEIAGFADIEISSTC